MTRGDRRGDKPAEEGRDEAEQATCDVPRVGHRDQWSGTRQPARAPGLRRPAHPSLCVALVVRRSSGARGARRHGSRRGRGPAEPHLVTRRAGSLGGDTGAEGAPLPVGRARSPRRRARRERVLARHVRGGRSWLDTCCADVVVRLGQGGDAHHHDAPSGKQRRHPHSVREPAAEEGTERDGHDGDRSAEPPHLSRHPTSSGEISP